MKVVAITGASSGIGLYGAIDQIPTDRRRRVLDVNYVGTWHAARAALPVFRRQQAGHLVVMSSIVGRRGRPPGAAPDQRVAV